VKFGAVAIASTIVEDDAVDPEAEEEDEEAVPSFVPGEVVAAPTGSPGSPHATRQRATAARAVIRLILPRLQGPHP